MVEGDGRQTEITGGREEETVRKEGSWGKKGMSGEDAEQINHCRHGS